MLSIEQASNNTYGAWDTRLYEKDNSTLVLFTFCFFLTCVDILEKC